MTLSLFFIAFAIVIFIQLIYYIFVFGPFSFGKNETKSPKNSPISVIFCAKNEAFNIQKNLPILLAQNYKNYEIVLIDDASTDETLSLFEQFEKDYANVKVVKVVNTEAFWGNKKWALTLGIKAAKNEHLVFIDADCYPVSENWLQTISSQFTDGKEIILGYGAYEKIPKSFLNKLVRFETVLTALQYFSWTKIGKPYMGVGRNLAYKKETFFNASGFQKHMKVRSGDDDLFINQVANKSNTALLYSKDSFTFSEPKKTFSSWFYQKRRHTTTSSFYKKFDKFQLGLFYTSQLFFIILALVLIAFQYQLIIVAILVFFRYLFTFTILNKTLNKLDEKDVLFWYPILEICIIFIQLSVFIVNIFKKPVHWK